MKANGAKPPIELHPSAATVLISIATPGGSAIKSYKLHIPQAIGAMPVSEQTPEKYLALIRSGLATRFGRGVKVV